MRNAHWVMVCIVGVLVCGAVFTIFYGVQANAWYTARKMVREEPYLTMVPQPLKDTRINSSIGMPLSCFGYGFEVPWKDLDRLEEHERIARVVFKSGPVIVFFRPKGKAESVEALQGGDPVQAQQIRALYGPETMASDYELERAILSMTPDQVSVFMPRNEAIRDSTLLLFKTFKVRREQSALYSVQTPNLRGFQKGDPSRDKSTALELFDYQDHRVEVLIGADRHGTVKITQADVNRIIQTLRPAPESKQPDVRPH